MTSTVTERYSDIFCMQYYDAESEDDLVSIFLAPIQVKMYLCITGFKRRICVGAAQP